MSTRQLVNGRSGNIISPDDRGMAFGDGVFETVAVVDGQPRLWDLHMDRLVNGARRLGLPEPPLTTLREETRFLIKDLQSAVVKVLFTRGSGEGRGYRPPARPLVTRVVTVHDAPAHPRENWQGVRVRICETRLGIQPRLAGIKHLNRLEQVLARSEWQDSRIAEGLMIDHNGFLVEATAANLFAVRRGTLLTPPLDEAGVEGVMRRCILERARREGIPVEVRRLYPEEIRDFDELFLTNSLFGVWPITEVEEQTFEAGPFARRCLGWVGAECFAPPGSSTEY